MKKIDFNASSKYSSGNMGEKREKPELPQNVTDAIFVLEQLGLTPEDWRILSEEISVRNGDRRRVGEQKKKA